MGRLSRCIRWTDVLILEGTPVLGVAFSFGLTTAPNLTRIILFLAAAFLLLVHIFTLNDWADFQHSKADTSARTIEVPCEAVSPQLLLVFSALCLVVGLLLLAFLGTRLFVLGITVAALGILYSHPRLNAKSMPILSTLLHLLGGFLHFLFGYVLFSPIDLRGVLIGLFFGVTFAAGHPVQEVRDFHEDREVGAKTNAIVFGARPNFFAGLILFAIQYAYLFMLAFGKVVPNFLALLAIICFLVHAFWSIAALRSGLTSESISRFQNRYRMLYALLGLAMLAAALTRQ